MSPSILTKIMFALATVEMPFAGGPPTIQLSTALALSGSLLVFCWYMMQKKKTHCIPGPTSLPVVGNLVQFVSNKECIPQLFNRWVDKYGPIFVIRIGKVDAVVINTMDLIREAFSIRAMVFSERPCSLPLIKKIYQGRGVTAVHGIVMFLLECSVWGKRLIDVRELTKLLFQGRMVIQPQSFYFSIFTELNSPCLIR